MTPVRRIVLRSDAPRTRRPDACLPVPHCTVLAPIFRKSQKTSGAQIDNLFIDLDDGALHSTANPRLQKARARMAKRLGHDHAGQIDNIFAETSPELIDALDLRITELLATRPRKMKQIRENLADLHAEMNGQIHSLRHPTPKDVLRIAAGAVVALVTIPLHPFF